MKKSFIAFLLLTLYFVPAFSQDENTDNKQVIADFIACFKKPNKEELSGKIAYPFKMAAPIPSIKNKQEFLTRYDELFDDTLVEKIATSDPDKDWKRMGWRGIMLGNGLIWLNEDGKLIAVNYQTVAKNKKSTLLIHKQKSYVHSSLKDFERPVYFLKTKKFKIRIDDMGNGNYRYASWPLQSKQSDKPDLIIENGQYIPEGTGGNHRYDFKNDGYVYSCDINVLGQSAYPPAELIIYKGEKAILSLPATIVGR